MGCVDGIKWQKEVVPYLMDIFDKDQPWGGDDRNQILFLVNIIFN